MKNLSAKVYQRVINLTFALALVISTLAAAVTPILSAQTAGAVAAPYSEGFEDGSTDWTNTNIASSGADGITASNGSKFGQAHLGSYTKWGSEYRNTFPAGGYDTQLDVFLDPSWAANNAGQFDFSSAINNQGGTHLRDFIFSFGSLGNGDATWYVNATNNAPGNATAAGRVGLTQTGWYTVKHSFRNVNGVLAVTMTITNKSTGAVAGEWLLSSPTDLIASVVGGNRYGWFPTSTYDHIGIDNAKLTMLNAPQPTAPQNGGTTIGVDNSVTFAWDAVSAATSYEVRYSTGPSRTPNNVDGELSTSPVTLTTATTSKTQANLPSGTIFWQVRAIVDGSTNGPWSNIWSTNVVTSVATNTTQNKTYATLKSAIVAANAGDTIRLDANIELAQMVFIDKALTLEGNNKTISAPYSFTENGIDNAVLTVNASNVTIKNVTLTNTATGVKPHGLVVQTVSNVTIDGVKLLNGRAGLIVNGSTVNASNITTQGNSWYGVNIDQASAVLNISGTNTHADQAGAPALYVDNRATATVNDLDSKYTKIAVGPSKPSADYYVLDVTAPGQPQLVESVTYVNGDVNAKAVSWTNDGEVVSKFKYIQYNNLSDKENGVVGYTEVLDGTKYTTDVAGSWSSATFYYQIVAVDAAGNESDPSEFGTVIVDREDPTANVSYSTTALTNGNVTVTLTANEVISTPAGWSKTSDTVYTKVYTANAAETVTFQDTAGNAGSTEVSVTNIDKTAPEVTVDPVTVTGNVATVTPQIAAQPDILGATDNITGNTDAAVEGATDDKTAAVDTDATDGSVFGLAWYWWLAILAALAALAWFIIAAIRRRNEEEA